MTGQKKRPTLGLAMIVKNEAHNLPRLIESVKDCVDEIHITDTGSTDNTIEVAQNLGCHVHHFEWCNDFSAARNASFEPVKTDYIMWLDGDDVLANQEEFKVWRDSIMDSADFWLADYIYAFNERNEPVCRFSRERVFRNHMGAKWKYFLHEGVVPNPQLKMRTNYVTSWKVHHLRTAQDLDNDKSRNLKIFQAHMAKGEKLDARMSYYYGKELYEAKKPVEAVPQLLAAIQMDDLEMHDRLLAIQFCSHAYFLCNQFEKSIEIAQMGLLLDPTRAEYHCTIGDCWIKLGKLKEAIPSFNAARYCTATFGGTFEAIFRNPDLYGIYPTNQLIRIYGQMGMLETAEQLAKESLDAFGPKEDTLTLMQAIQDQKQGQFVYTDAKECDDIVFSCPPTGAYEWDGKLFEEKMMGGSETAAIQMAEALARKTDKKVIIYNMRKTPLTYKGVEYRPADQLPQYMRDNKPSLHIAWRHNQKVTNAPTFLWCHDLWTPGCENTSVYNKILCLTPFHRDYVHAMKGVPLDKIHVTRNGLVTERFKGEMPKKQKLKFVFPSSPDRGLDRTMRVLDIVREKYPEIELHVFYGIENLHKYGLADLQRELGRMMEEREWVKYHGATEQRKLIEHFKTAQYWLHPCDFIETSCITAMEMLACGVYPITRALGGLKDTLAKAQTEGMATLLPHDCRTQSEHQAYADATLDAIESLAYTKVHVDLDYYDWDKVADEWLEELPKL